MAGPCYKPEHIIYVFSLFYAAVSEYLLSNSSNSWLQCTTSGCVNPRSFAFLYMSFLLDSILILNLSLNIFLKNKNLIAKFMFLSEVLRCFIIFELNKTALIHRNL